MEKDKKSPITVVIADDYRNERDMMLRMLADMPEYSPVVLRFADEAVEYCKENPVDLAVIDVMMPRGIDGIGAAKLIKRRNPKIKIILITSACEDACVERSKAAGVESFWYKNYSRESFTEIVDRTASGESVYPDIKPNAVLGMADREDFSEMDLRILRCMMGGLNNIEIAAQVGLTADGVRYHIKSMLKKTGYPNRVSLVVNAVRFGIVLDDGGKA